MRAPAFVFFGPAHLAALGLTALAAIGLALWARRLGNAAAVDRVRKVLAVVLAAAAVTLRLAEAHEGIADFLDLVPLELCDVNVLVAVYALATRNRLACEALYFWGYTGTLLAMVTPDINAGFPSLRFASYFGLHGAVVVTAAFVVWGLGLRPRPGAPWRAFLLTNVYAALMAVVNLVTGANFFYLCRKPPPPTLLDAFGPWPVYILVAEAFALGAFAALHWPARGPAAPRSPTT